MPQYVVFIKEVRMATALKGENIEFIQLNSKKYNELKNSGQINENNLYFVIDYAVDRHGNVIAQLFKGTQFVGFSSREVEIYRQNSTATSARAEALSDEIAKKLEQFYTIGIGANQVTYDSSNSGLEASTVQEAIDLLATTGETPTTFKGIQDAVRAGLARFYFKPGDEIVVTSNTVTDFVLTWVVIGIDQDIPVDSKYQHSLTLQLKTVLPGWFAGALDTKGLTLPYNFSPSDSFTPGLGESPNDWMISDVRGYLASGFGLQLKEFNKDFYEILGEVQKVNSSYLPETSTFSNYITEDKFFILSASELGKNGGGKDQAVYSYYNGASNELFTKTYIDGKPVSSGDWAYQWTRTPRWNTTQIYMMRLYQGLNGTGGDISSSRYIVPACCIV